MSSTGTETIAKYNKLVKEMNLLRNIISCYKSVKYKGGGKFTNGFEIKELIISSPPSNKDAQLFSLVVRANDGLKALEKLKMAYRDQVEISVNDGPYTELHDNARPLDVRIKKKHELRLGDLNITVCGKNIDIGCMTFKVSKVIKALDKLLEGCVHEHRYGPEGFFIGTAKGIRHKHDKEYSGNYSTSIEYLSWENCRKLRDVLEGHNE